MQYVFLMIFLAMFSVGILRHGTTGSVPSISTQSGLWILSGSQMATLFDVYREAVNNYLDANPGFTGTVPVSSLSLPLGTVVPPVFSNSCSGGTAWVWVPPPTANVLGPLALKTFGDLLVGINRSGTLVPANNSPTGIAVPGSIPNGSVVSVWYAG